MSSGAARSQERQECEFNGQLYVVELRNKDCRDSFVEASPVHIDHRSDGEDKPGWSSKQSRRNKELREVKIRSKLFLNLAICWLTPFLDSMQWIVTGKVAELEPVPKAVIRALKLRILHTCRMYLEKQRFIKAPTRPC